MPASASQENILIVSREETGMKLLRFLERRLPGPPPQSALHKWIRTGQVRINGGRGKAFALLHAGDAVRVPPFAALSGAAFSETHDEAREHADPLRQLAASGLPLAAATESLLVINKPAGLAAQAGTGHQDSVAGRLATAWKGHAYHPAPAHRLDRHTTGLILAGRHHAAQQALHLAFSGHSGITKDYLAWVAGRWPEERPCLLTDSLYKDTIEGTGKAAGGRHSGGEKMRARPGGTTLPLDAAQATGDGEVVVQPKGSEREHTRLPDKLELNFEAPESLAYSLTLPVMHAGEHIFPGEATLMLVRLLTGKTHQIRVQLASRGFPLIGDGRYGGPRFAGMLLHAWRIALSQKTALALDISPDTVFSAPPPWPGAFMPEEHTLVTALARLELTAGRM